jgi:hypothetical protein
VGQRAGAGAAVLLGEREREHVVLTHQLDRVPRELGRVVDLGRPRRNVLAGEGAHRIHQHLAVVGERVEVAGVSHG